MQLLLSADQFFGAFAFGDFLEKNREPIAGRINAVFKPAIPWWIVIFHRDRLLFPKRPLIILMKFLTEAFGKFSPDVLPDQVLRLSAKHLGCAFIDVGISPVFIQRHE